MTFYEVINNCLTRIKYLLLTVVLIGAFALGCGTEDQLTPSGASDAPSSLVAVAMSKNEVALFWKDNSLTEDGFVIERKSYPEGKSGTYQVLTRTGPNVTSYRDKSSSLKPDTTYYYRVAYYKGSEVSDFSNAASETTLAKALALRKDSGDMSILYEWILSGILEKKLGLQEGGICPSGGTYTTASQVGDSNTTVIEDIFADCRIEISIEDSYIILNFKDFVTTEYINPSGYRVITMDGVILTDWSEEEITIQTLVPIKTSPIDSTAHPFEGEIRFSTADNIYTVTYTPN